MSLQDCFQSRFPLATTVLNLSNHQSQQMAKALREAGLYRGQDLLLKAIHDFGPCSQNTIREHLGLDHSTIAKSVSRLQNSGYVQSMKSEEDKRVTLVSITDDGKIALEKAMSVFQCIEDRSLQGFSTEEKEIFLSLAQRIVQNISE